MSTMADRYTRAICLLHRRNLFTQISRRRIGTGVITPIFLSAENYRWRTAVIDAHGRHTYGQILDASAALARKLRDQCPAVHQVDKFTGPRIGYMSTNDVSSIVSKWATWMLGGVAVPLSPSHPQSELEYFLQDSQSSAVITTAEFSDSLQPIADKLDITHVQLNEDDFLSTDIPKTTKEPPKSRFGDLLSTNQFKKQAAVIIYTSGTTGRPKGVVHTHGSLCTNMEMMRMTWGICKSDTSLNVLPLHHIHGLLNCVMTPMSVGATCVMISKFDAHQVWSSLLNPVSTEPLTRVNLFMAVPTVYAKLVQFMDEKLEQGATDNRWTKDFIRSTFSSRIRLMVSGSAALPEPVMLRWEELTGYRLVERYGMTETGMVLTNPVLGPRTPGTVGRPFPGIEVRLAKANVYAQNGYDVISTGNSRSTNVTSGMESESGELHVKGPNLFREYWAKPEATQETFTSDGWFKTGDTAAYDVEGYKILGRTSVDIIKSGGYKISALDIERHLLSHPAIRAVSVVGLPDITWGQKVAALVELNKDCQLSLAELRDWSREKMPPYHIPTVLRCIPQLPYNALGKVNKKDVVKMYFANDVKNKQ